MKQVLLTGLPRSGTTLCCAILNAVPDVLALVEPWPVTRFSGTRSEMLAMVGAALSHSQTLAERGLALSKGRGDQIATNIVGEKGPGSIRRVVAQPMRIPIEPLAPQGTLVVKHNAFFTALLPALAARFHVFGVIRNPVSVLASWRSVDLPVRSGRLPAAQLADPNLAQRLDRCRDRDRRQRLILNWFFERYQASLPMNRIVRYEDLVEGTSEPLRYLGVMNWETRTNENRSYSLPAREQAARELLTEGGSHEVFYTREDLLSAAS